jgi:hypothetical protein
VVPVGHPDLHGQLVVSAGGGWRRNLAGGADLEVTLDGASTTVGLNPANRLGLRLNVDRARTRQELQASLADRKMTRLDLVDTQRSAP